MAAPLLHPPGPGARLSDWLDYQERLHPRSIELGLGRVREVAARLGLPDTGVRTLTIGGTNGKGSSATLASLIYREAGYRVGLYTSPHLHRYNERIAVDGTPIADAELCHAFEVIEQARGELSLTYFEFGTLAALWWFRESGVQVQVLEVGLGGRLDAVNLVDADAALVTNIGLDHLDWLGPDRESIAVEKAGIFRHGRPAVSADRDPPAAIAGQAAQVGAPLWQLGRDYDFSEGENGWSWRSADADLADLPPPGLPGAAQRLNAAGVIAAVQRLQPVLPVPPSAIRAALPKLQLSGRFQQRGRFWLDVAHNAEAATVLAQHLAGLPGQRRNWLVLGMLSDKPLERVIQVLAPQAAGFVFAGLPPPRGLSGAECLARTTALGVQGSACDDVDAALERAVQFAGADDRIVVCGSFLTVAAAADWLDRGGLA